jgi:hypothetical protein
MQAGRASDGLDGGVLSPYWDPVQQHFARFIFEAMTEQVVSPIEKARITA